MDDATICGQLRQIFPQIEPRVIEKTVEEAKTNEVVDILTHCIEVVLARQEKATWFGDNNNDQQGNDDVVVVKSIRKETSRKGKTRDIPLVCVKEDAGSDLSDYDSDSSIHDSESSDDEDDNRMGFIDKNNYFGSSSIMNEFYDRKIDKLIKDMRVPPSATPIYHQVVGPASQFKPKFPNHQFSVMPSQQPSATPIPEPSAILGQHTITDLQPAATPNCQSLATRNQLATTPSQYQPSITPNRQPSATPNRQSSATPNRQHSPTPNWQPLATHNRKPSATPNKQFSAIPYQFLPLIQPMLATQNNQSYVSSSPELVSVENSPLVVIQQMYPKVNVDFIQNLSQQGYDLNGIVNMLIDRPDMQNSGSSPEQPTSMKEPTPTKEINYFTEFSEMPYDLSYFRQCETLLRNEFQRVSVNDIRKVLHMCNGHYAPARKLLEEALLDMNQNQGTKAQVVNVVQKNTSPTTSSANPPKKFIIHRLLASKRGLTKITDKVCNELQLEIDFVKKQAMLNEEKKNAIYASYINKQQYLDEGELIECGCCFGEFPFEEIVQCSDGHLFCKECLHGYAKEIIFGSAMASARLSCMGEDCDQPFPYNQLEKCLTKDEIDKYQSRLQEDCLAKVDIPNFYQCEFCEFGAIIPEGQKVFACVNPKCLKEWCIECKEDWKDHFGKKCNEVEKKSQTNLRLSYEERMTMAKVRKCAKCSLTFTKLDGCNKMTCRCGTTQCYVCRKSAINYNHFCRHPRDPGQKCRSCVACSLWTDPTEDDELAIKQLQEEAAVAKRKLMEEIQQSANKKQKV